MIYLKLLILTRRKLYVVLLGESPILWLPLCFSIQTKTQTLLKNWKTSSTITALEVLNGKNILRWHTHVTGTDYKFYKLWIIDLNYRKGCSTDYNKPLLIPYGADSFSQLEINVKTLKSPNQGLMIERFKHFYTAVFPQVIGQSSETDWSIFWVFTSYYSQIWLAEFGHQRYEHNGWSCQKSKFQRALNW